MSRRPSTQLSLQQQIANAWHLGMVEVAQDQGKTHIEASVDNDGTVLPHTWSQTMDYVAQNLESSNIEFLKCVVAAQQDLTPEGMTAHLTIASRQWGTRAEALEKTKKPNPANLEEIYGPGKLFGEEGLPYVGREFMGGGKGKALLSHLGGPADYSDTLIVEIDDEENDHAYQKTFGALGASHISMHGKDASSEIIRKFSAKDSAEFAGLTEEEQQSRIAEWDDLNESSCIKPWHAIGKAGHNHLEMLERAQSKKPFGFCPQSALLHLIKIGKGHLITPEIITEMGCEDLRDLSTKLASDMGVPAPSEAVVDKALARIAEIEGESDALPDLPEPPLPDLPTTPSIYDTVSPPSQEELDLKDLREALKTATSSFNPTDPAAAARSNATSVLKALRDRSTVEIAGPQSFFTSDGKPLDLYAVAAEAGNGELLYELKSRGVKPSQEKYSGKEAIEAALAKYQEKTREAQDIRSTKVGGLRGLFSSAKNKAIEATAVKAEEKAAADLAGTINNLAANEIYDLSGVEDIIANYKSKTPASSSKDKALTTLDTLKDFLHPAVTLARSKSRESLKSLNSADGASRRMAWMSSGLPSEPSAAMEDPVMKDPVMKDPVMEGPVMGVKPIVAQPRYVNLEELRDGQRSSETDSLKDIAGSHASLDTVATNTTVDSGYEAEEDPNIAFANAFEGAMAEYKIDAKQLKGRDHRFYTVTIQSDYANTPDTLVIVKVRYEENEQGISAPTGQVEVAVNPPTAKDGSAILRPRSEKYENGAVYEDLGSVDRRIIDTISSWAQHEYTPREVAQSKPATPAVSMRGEPDLGIVADGPPTGSAHVTAFQPGTHTKAQRITLPEGDARKESQSNVGKMRQQFEQQALGGGVPVR